MRKWNHSEEKPVDASHHALPPVCACSALLACAPPLPLLEPAVLYLDPTPFAHSVARLFPPAAPGSVRVWSHGSVPNSSVAPHPISLLPFAVKSLKECLHMLLPPVPLPSLSATLSHRGPHPQPHNSNHTCQGYQSSHCYIQWPVLVLITSGPSTALPQVPHPLLLETLSSLGFLGPPIFLLPRSWFLVLCVLRWWWTGPPPLYLCLPLSSLIGALGFKCPYTMTPLPQICIPSLGLSLSSALSLDLPLVQDVLGHLGPPWSRKQLWIMASKRSSPPNPQPASQAAAISALQLLPLPPLFLLHPSLPADLSSLTPNRSCL